MIRLWPRNLGGRLVLLLVSALAVAQAIVVLVIQDEQKGVIEALAHGQALSQTVTLARLLAHYPPSEAARITSAFGSRVSCAVVVDTPPQAPQSSMDASERRLADILTQMLHGDFAGSPRVDIERSDTQAHPCNGDSASFDPYGRGDARSAPPPRRFGVFSAQMTVPLKDGRTLIHRTFVEPPPIWTLTAVLFFVLSSVVVTGVVVVSVRNQTKSLRALASAADRLGRGEQTPPLDVLGPSEVAAATRAFNTMQERLRRFVADRIRLLAAVSHDLRTPLTTLRLKAEFIEDRETRDDLISTIDELTVITEATLAFTHAEATAEETEVVDLVRLVGEVVDDFRLAETDVAMTDHAAISLACRPIALKRAVRNLVENAVRYGRRARVSFGMESLAPLVVIDDDGPGLPEGAMEEAFEAFVRLEPSRSADTGGIGLGLSIARGIVQAHGGSIVLANRPEGGLRATLRLPPRSAD